MDERLDALDSNINVFALWMNAARIRNPTVMTLAHHHLCDTKGDRADLTLSPGSMSATRRIRCFPA